MTSKCTYRKVGDPAIVVVYPTDAEPIVPQSCYAFGSPKHVDICRGVNELSQRAFETCRTAGMSKSLAEDTVSELVDTLVCAMGYVRTSNESI